MAEAMLGIVIENLQSFAQDQVATFWGVDQQTQKLFSNLNAIHAVLKDAERKQITSHTVKDWLQKLTDATYVLEDILDEYSLHSQKVQCGGQNSCLARVHPKDIVFRCYIGKKMKDITQRFHELDEERRKFELRDGVSVNQPPDDNEWRQTISVITEPTIYGRDQDRDKIMKFLLGSASNNEDLSVYPIVGMAGLGKTTLAKRIFNEDEVRNHFDMTIWVYVSNDFNIKTILQSIIESTTGQNLKLGTLEALQKNVQEVLQSKRYLLVLDDVWNEDQEKWKQLKGILQCTRGTKGSAVLVTTRLEQVASIMETYLAHHLVELSDEDSWSLFKHHAFGPNTEGSAELVPIGKDIVRKCVGSPLAIKTLGSLLRGKRLVQQWKNVKESEIWDIREESSLTSKENSIMRALKLSYVNLELTLRRCFSFCAIFPKGSEIVKEDLIHLWMGNEFIKPEKNLEVEDVGEEVWEKLYHRSFFQEAKADVFGIITSFKMHDLFHDLATSLMGEECKVSEYKELTDLPRRVHHLHFLTSRKAVNMSALKKVESLRTLLDFVQRWFDGHSGPLPSNRSLRVLRTCPDQLSKVMNLAHLRYLNLCGSDATSLPNSICGLQKLQILKLKYFSDLYCLPKDLTRLQDLRHLVIEGCYSIAEMPPNIGKLRHLRTLSSFIVGSKPGYGLAELNGLKLGGKLHISGLENVPSEWDAQQANLRSKKDLNRLYLSWGGSTNSEGSNVNAERVLEALEPASTLKSFGMRRYQGIQLPSWMRELKDLVEVILFGCENCKELPPLGKLPHLKRLYIYEMNDVTHIDGESEKAFPSLEKLTVRKLPKLERVLRDEGIEMLPRLTELIIDDVPYLKLPRLPSVEHLRASNIKDGASFMEVVVGNLPCLKTLKIDTIEKLKVLPDQLSRLGALQELNISNCKELESLSEDVLQGLTSLRSLGISYCEKLKSLPEGVGHLTGLERILIGGCPELVDLPNNMNKLTALREMSIWVSRILPEGLQHIPSLQTLVIYDCECTSLPDWLGDMTSLRQLIIWNCPELRSLPSNIQRLTNLSKLTIEDCPELRSLPSNIQRLPNLTELTIDGCPELRSLPDWLGDMTSLRQLEICFCWELRSLPSNIQRLTNLRQLSISYCPKLSSLPSSIQRLTNLRELSIKYCPELEKRCKKETGEDWQYIAHIPQLLLKESEKETFGDKIRATFKKLQIRPRSTNWGDAFDRMVDDERY